MKIVETFSSPTLNTTLWDFQNNVYSGSPNGTYSIANNKITIVNGTGWNNTTIETKNKFSVTNKLVIECDYVTLGHYASGDYDRVGFGAANATRPDSYYRPYDANWFYYSAYGTLHIKIEADFIAKTVKVYINNSTSPSSTTAISDTMLTAMKQYGIRVDFSCSGYSPTCSCTYANISVDDFSGKALIASNGSSNSSPIYTVKAGSYGAVVGVTKGTLTQATFDSEGIQDLTSALSLIPLDKFDLLYWEYGMNSTSKAASLSAVPNNPKIVVAKSDISLQTIENINSVTITETSVPVIISVDKGVTWKTWDNGWMDVDVNDVNAVYNRGMSATTLNTRSKQDWINLIAGSKGIRFGYALKIDSEFGVAKTDVLTFNVDMKGEWYNALAADFRYSYPLSSLIKIQLFSSGDYKINY